MKAAVLLPLVTTPQNQTSRTATIAPAAGI
jgi:hypothetical protein